MADYVLSGEADNDLNGIYEYSYRNFGEATADDYVSDLRGSFQLLADNPAVGRPAEEIRSRLLSFHHARHVVFYVRKGEDVLIVRVLHESMDFSRHLA